jgi:hypothetical protein
MLLPACATKQVHSRFIPPPPLLTADCPKTEVDLRVNADLVKALRARNVDLAKCNQDKADLRSWVADMSKPGG